MQRKVTYKSVDPRSESRRTRKRGKKYSSRHDEHKQKSSQKRSRRFDRFYKEQGRNFCDPRALRESQLCDQYSDFDQLMREIDNVRGNQQTTKATIAWEKHLALLKTEHQINEDERLSSSPFDDMLLKRKRQVQTTGCLVCLECNLCIPLDNMTCKCPDDSAEWLWVQPDTLIGGDKPLRIPFKGL